MEARMQCCGIDLSSTGEFLSLIAEPNRLKIICLLKKKEHCICDLQQELGMKHNLVLHHIKKLKGVGLLKKRKDEKHSFYSLERGVYEKRLQEITKILE